MSISRQLLTIVLSGMVIFSVAVAEAKGPKGPKGNQGKRSSFSTGSSQGQGIQGGGWTTPPGWTQGEKKGWDGQTVPPGVDNGKNRAGRRKPCRPVFKKSSRQPHTACRVVNPTDPTPAQHPAEAAAIIAKSIMQHPICHPTRWDRAILKGTVAPDDSAPKPSRQEKRARLTSSKRRLTP